MKFPDYICNHVQGSVFKLLLVLFLCAGLYAPIWPIWDSVEGNFVHSLLATMRGEADSSGAWYGAKVQGQDTALVSGPLYAQRAPRNNATDEVFSECVALRRDTEILTMAMTWKVKTTQTFMGEGITVAGWAVDPRFLRSAIVPATRTHHHKWDDRNVQCPLRSKSGKPYNICRYVDYCITAEDHSILGVIGVSAQGGRMIALPNDTLIDYPLMQRGFYAPDAFSVPYRDSMQKRIKVYPLFIASIQAICVLFLLSIANGALAQGLRSSFSGGAFQFQKISLLWFNNHIGFIRVLYGLVLGPMLRAKKPFRSLEWQTTLLGMILPALPLLAYHLMLFGALFDLVMFAYIMGFACFLYMICAWNRQTNPRKHDHGK
jgi:hypothetical protein